MALEIVQPTDVLEVSRRTLGLSLQSVENPDTVDDVFLAAFLRRCAGFLCPCSAITLRTAVMESLQNIVVEKNLADHIEEIIEALTIGGDLLEIDQVTIDDPAVRDTWLFAAPPGFIVRSSGDIFLKGIVADQDTYLPKALSRRLRLEGCARIITPEANEDLLKELTDLGFQCISKENWLKAPRMLSAEKVCADLENRLKTSSRSGSIADLELLDPEKPVTYYRGRWLRVKKQSGIFVARRPQEYGSPIWCMVEIEDGATKKLLDFPLPKQRWRGCDIAWHLQMAIDYLHGNPQRYRVRSSDDEIYLDFFSPLPLWAQRRLMIIGRKTTPQKCLMSFRVSKRGLQEEEQFLKERLWLAPQNDTRSV